MPGDYLRAGVLVAVVVSAAMFAGATTAATGGSISASSDSPGETTEHTVKATADSDDGGSSWNGLQVDYSGTGADVGEVGSGDITEIYINPADGGDNISASDDIDDVSVSNNNETLGINLFGNYNLAQGDQVVVSYNDVQNPDVGDYEIDVYINEQSSTPAATGTLSISEETTTSTTDSSTTESSTTESSTTESSTTESSTTESSTTESSTTESSTTESSTTESSTTESSTTESPTTESPTTESPTTESPTTTSGGDGDISSPDPNPAGVVSETEPSVSSVPDEAGATAAHTVGTLVGYEIGDSSWTGLEVDYSGTGTDVSNVGQGDVVKIGVDRGNNDSNATVDRSLAASLGEVSGSNDGETLTFGLDGDYELQEGDQIIVVYEDVQNPDAGDYSVGIDVNPQSSGEEVTATLDIDAANTATATATETAESTSTATAEPTETATAEPPATTEESTPSTSPGFGTVAAVVALAAAAALLVRR